MIDDQLVFEAYQWSEIYVSLFIFSYSKNRFRRYLLLSLIPRIGLVFLSWLIESWTWNIVLIFVVDHLSSGLIFIWSQVLNRISLLVWACCSRTHVYPLMLTQDRFGHFVISDQNVFLSCWIPFILKRKSWTIDWKYCLLTLFIIKCIMSIAESFLIILLNRQKFIFSFQASFVL